MNHAAITSAFETTVVLSTAAALAIGARALTTTTTPTVSATSAPRSRLPSLLLHPLAQFLLVCAVIYLNQVLFGAFILTAHHGSTAFISRFIPGGWFAIGARDPLVAFAAKHVGDGQWLSPTLLRVQAFLELPFTMFAYLAVARLLGRGLYATLCKPAVLGLVSISFSITFSLVELMLPNPYTTDDLVLRGVACLVVPVYIAWISRAEAKRAPASKEDGPFGVLGLFTFLAGAGAIAYVVLALYDAFLLYNLARFPQYAAGIAVSLVVASLASFAAPRVDGAFAKLLGKDAQASPGMDACLSAVRAFTILFAVPSLSLRYWGAHPSAVLCGLLVVGIAMVAGIAGALRRARLGPGNAIRLMLAGGLAVFAGGWAGHLALTSTASHVMPELVLARVALSFLGVAILTFRAAEIALVWDEHETKAPADEA